MDLFGDLPDPSDDPQKGSQSIFTNIVDADVFCVPCAKIS